MNERRKVDLNAITREMDNLSHTLIDLKTIAQCNKNTIGRLMENQTSIDKRIELLESRQDRLAVELGRAKNGQSTDPGHTD